MQLRITLRLILGDPSLYYTGICCRPSLASLRWNQTDLLLYYHVSSTLSPKSDTSPHLALSCLFNAVALAVPEIFGLQSMMQALLATETLPPR